MKYMSFNNSCSHAAICTLLEKRGIELEPDVYLKRMKAYLLMDKDFATGAMLQTDEAYSFGLLNFDLSFRSCWVSDADELKEQAKALIPCILPLQLEGRKHAVILDSWSSEGIKLINMKRKGENSPDQYIFSEGEFFDKVSYPLPLGVLKEGGLFSKELLEKSKQYHRAYQKQLEQFVLKDPSLEEIKAHLPLLRTLLLDLPDSLRRVDELASLS